MTAQIRVTQKLAVQGSMDALAMIRRQVADVLGGEPTSWKWELGLDEALGRVMLLTATR